MTPVAPLRPSILVIAESASDAEVAVAALESNDCEILVAEDGETGIRHAARQLPHLILLDAGKPGGFDLCRRLKAQAATRDIPVILIAAGFRKPDRKAVFAAGGADYLAKPYLPEELAARIAPYIRLNAVQRQLNDKSAELEQRSAQHSAELNSSVELLRFKTFAINNMREAAYLIDPDGRFRYVNTEACRTLGYSAEELLGMGVADIDPDVTAEIGRRQWSELVHAGTMQIESRHRRKDGSIFPVEIVASYFEYHGKAYNLALVRDLSDRKRTEEKLALLTAAVDRVQETIYLIDAESRIRYVNQESCRVLGYTSDELLSMRLKDIDPAATVEQWKEWWSELVANRRFWLESSHHRIDGSSIPIEVSAHLFEHEGKAYSLCFVRDITERKRTQREILLLNHAMQNSGDATFLIDKQGRFTYVNEAACRSLGYSRDELLTMGPLDIDPDMPPEAFHHLRTEFFRVGPTRGVIESRHRRRDGSIFSVDISSSLIDYDGEKYAFTLVRDITGRKEAERRLHASEQAFRALVENSPDYVARYDRDCRRIYVNPATIALNGGTSAEDLLGTTPLQHSVMIDAPSFVERIRQVFDTGEAVTAEVRYRGGKGEPRWADARIVPEFGPDGRVVSVLAISRDITGIKESEQRFRTLTENSPDNLIRHDRAGRVIYVNPRMLKTWGLKTAEHVIGKTLIEAFGNADSRRSHSLHMQVMERGTAVSYDFTVPDTGNGVRYHTVLVVPERNEAGEVVGALAIGRNITERKRAERQLALLTTAVNHSFDAFYLVDSELRLRYVNDAAVRDLGYSRKELLALDLTGIDPDIDPQQVRELMRHTAAAGVFPGTVETRHRTKDGRFFPVEIGASAVVHDGETVFLTIARDITERKAAEQQLHASEQQFRALAENSPDAIARYDREVRRIYLNPAMIALQGKSAEELLGATPLQGSVLVDVPFYVEAVRRVFDTGEVLATELQYRHADGELRWGDSRFVPEFGADGKVATVLMFCRDITSIKESEQRFRTLAENSPDNIVRQDRDGRIVYVNPCMLKTWGMKTAESVVGKTLAELFGNLYGDSYHAMHMQVMEDRTPVTYDFTVEDFGNAVQHHNILVVPEYNDAGEVVGALALGRDVTERMRAEQARMDHMSFLEGMDRVNRAIREAGDLDRMMAAVLDIVLSILGCDRAFLMYPCDPDAETWSVPMERTRPEYPGLNATTRKTLPIDADIAPMLRLLLDADGPVAFGPGNEHPLPAGGAEQFGFRCFMSMALRPKTGKAWQFGIHQCSHTRIWTAAEQRLLAEVGRRLADSLTALLAQRDLQNSELRYREIFENTTDAIMIWEVTAEGRFRLLDANPVWSRMAGVDHKTFAGRWLDDVADRAVVQRVIGHFRACIAAKESLDYEEDFDTRTGLWHLHTTLVPICDTNGEIYRMIAVSHDITERKRMEQALSLSERQYRTLVEQMPDFVVRYDGTLRRTYVNPAWESASGLSARDVLDAPLETTPKVPKPIINGYHAALRKTLETGARQTVEFSWVNARGATLQLQYLVAPEYDEDGKVAGVLAVGRDITERKRAERELALLHHAVDQSHDAIYLVDADLRLRYVNDAAVRFLGYTREELMTMQLTDIDLDIKPGQVRDLMNQAAAAGPSQGTIESRHRTRFGRIFPVEVGASAVTDNDELLLLTVARDISERKRMEIELRRQADFQQTLLNGFNDAGMQLVILENGRAIYYSNRKLAHEFGLSDAEIDAHPVMIDYIDPDDRARVADLHRRRLAGEAVPSTYELGMMVPGGMRRDFEVAVAVIPETDPVRMIAVIKDITERKKTERALQESYDMLQDLSARRDSAREEEKMRIAREIHDELGQQLTALRMGISAVGFEFGNSQPVLMERVKRLTGMADGTIKEVRNIATALRPAVLDTGIGAALEWLVAEFERHTDIACELRLARPLPKLDNYREIALFRIVQESLTNVARHAKARNVAIALASGDNACNLEITDDGCGFDPTMGRPRSFGLTGMRERALMLRSELVIDSRPGFGTAIKLAIPLSDKKDAT